MNCYACGYGAVGCTMNCWGAKAHEVSAYEPSYGKCCYGSGE